MAENGVPASNKMDVANYDPIELTAAQEEQLPIQKCPALLQSRALIFCQYTDYYMLTIL